MPHFTLPSPLGPLAHPSFFLNSNTPPSRDYPTILTHLTPSSFSRNQRFQGKLYTLMPEANIRSGTKGAIPPHKRYIHTLVAVQYHTSTGASLYRLLQPHEEECQARNYDRPWVISGRHDMGCWRRHEKKVVQQSRILCTVRIFSAFSAILHILRILRILRISTRGMPAEFDSVSHLPVWSSVILKGKWLYYLQNKTSLSKTSQHILHAAHNIQNMHCSDHQKSQGDLTYSQFAELKPCNYKEI